MWVTKSRRVTLAYLVVMDIKVGWLKENGSTCQVLSEKHMTPKPISVLWRADAQNSPSCSSSSLQTEGAAPV